MRKVIITALEKKEFCCSCKKKTYYEYIPYSEKIYYEENDNMIKFKNKWYACVECIY